MELSREGAGEISIAVRLLLHIRAQEETSAALEGSPASSASLLCYHESRRRHSEVHEPTSRSSLRISIEVGGEEDSVRADTGRGVCAVLVAQSEGLRGEGSSRRHPFCLLISASYLLAGYCSRRASSPREVDARSLLLRLSDNRREFDSI